MVAPVRIQDHFPVAPEKRPESDVIVPYTGDVQSTGTIDVPNGLSSYEYIEVFGGTTYDALAEYKKIDKSELVTGFITYLIASTASNERYCSITVTDDNTITIGNSVTSAGVAKLVGYKKRYATENNSVIIPVNGGNNIAVNSRYEVKLQPEYYELDGSVKKGVSVRAEIYNNSGTGEARWFTAHKESYMPSDNILRSSGVWAEIDSDNNKVFVCTSSYGGDGNGHLQNYLLPNSANITAHIVSAPCRVIATLNDRTSISVPVGDKGYGGLRKDTVDTVALADFTVPNAIDFNLPLVSSPLKVTQNVSNNRLSLSQIGIWGSSGSINLTFDSGNNGREIIADIYNETKGQVALEKPEYVARNQLGITIPISVDVLEILTSGDEYSLRVRSNDAFTNVKVGKCWWDVTLNAPL